MKILKLISRNIKKIKAVEINPKGNMVVIGGKNEQGKSSILDSIIYALNGKESIPEKPIRDGETQATVLVQTEDYIITREFTKTNTGYKTTLRIVTNNGESLSSPQTELNNIINDVYDVFEFVKNPDVRYKTFLKLADIDINKVNDKIRYIEEKRRFVGRDLKNEKALLSQMPTPEYNLPNEPVSTNALMEKYNHAVNMEKNSIRIKDKENRIVEYKLMIEDLKKKIQDTENEILELKRLTENVDVKAIEKEIAEVEELNKKILHRNAYSDKQNLIQTLHEEYEQLTLERDTIVSDTKQKFNSIMEGLEINDKKEILLNGINFEELSQAQKIKIAIETICKLNPELKIAIIREGSLIDETNLEYLSELAEKYNIQIWIEKVGNAEIIIEEGEIK